MSRINYPTPHIHTEIEPFTSCVINLVQYTYILIINFVLKKLLKGREQGHFSTINRNIENLAVFSEKTDVPNLQNQSMVAISVMKLSP